MGRPVLIYGKPGTGKTRSMKYFGDSDVFLVEVVKADLPFKNCFKYMIQTNDIDKIKNGLAKMPCKVAIIDDATYLMVDAFMKEHAKKGVNQFDLYNRIADGMYNLITYIRSLPDDVIVYLIMHEDPADDYGYVKLKTIGKLLDSKCPIESMVTIALRCMSDGKRHYFRTQTDGFDLTKSPEDMFADVEIENDLKMVDSTIREYYGLQRIDTQKKAKKENKED